MMKNIRGLGVCMCQFHLLFVSSRVVWGSEIVLGAKPTSKGTPRLLAFSFYKKYDLKIITGCWFVPCKSFCSMVLNVMGGWKWFVVIVVLDFWIEICVM
jgi:hypothetical protein